MHRALLAHCCDFQSTINILTEPVKLADGSKYNTTAAQAEWLDRGHSRSKIKEPERSLSFDAIPYLAVLSIWMLGFRSYFGRE